MKKKIFKDIPTPPSLPIYRPPRHIAKVKPEIRIIHVFTPEVIKTDTENFRELVQRLTGKSLNADHQNRKLGPSKTTKGLHKHKPNKQKMESLDGFIGSAFHDEDYFSPLLDIERFIEGMNDLPLLPIDPSLAIHSSMKIAAGLTLDIMPGSNDPTNFSLPQKPLNRCLFPSSAAYNTFRSCPNPHCFEIDGVKFLGTSGQNIHDLEKYSEAKDKLKFMERTLKWRHLAPTAPNTLGCYPFTDRDPFLIESCPHVYFVGNQDKYETRLMKGSEGQLVRLICVPKFCETGVAVMVNTNNLECRTLSFNASFSS
ncbi:hypothetical protein SAY86_018149 [Trapa natans]|uniref:VQ domain-containing protein n=1 Tax=Trapa natans TaxID=22666 RepID=A0AAN7R1E0_TRANT|nr:hypothetical protein SAY86_018149 [Trapa natans]